MGFFSNSKSSKLREFQSKISPPVGNFADVTKAFKYKMENSDAIERALDDFFNFCAADKEVRAAMRSEQLSLTDIKQIYRDLCSRGLGEHGAMSIIAYAEPLLYFVRASKRGESELKIIMSLQDYCGGRLKGIDLLRQVE